MSKFYTMDNEPYEGYSIIYDFFSRNLDICCTIYPGDHDCDFEASLIDFWYVPGNLIEAYMDVYPEKFENCRKNHIVIITDSSASKLFGKANSTESNGFKYWKKCPDPLIGVDVDLFSEHPDFPYAKDRPKCFYDVRVDGQKSSYEAFYDEDIRWKMIVNRILYSGGFIDARWVLQALNITRTCKQPSWFSKTLAKQIISKYCTSETIVDLFAGWGARADAANELHRKYVGCDFNKELVDWHHECGRINITYADAHEFKYDGDCSVFICPPYSDPATGRCFEDYNFDGFDAEAKGLSQCDWMKITMQNVPNAREYILVCKIVDKGWGKYIVASKSNKSHFGVNNEYILWIPKKERDIICNQSE